MSEVRITEAKAGSIAVPIKELRARAHSALRANFAVCAMVSLAGATLIWPMISPSAFITTSYRTLTDLFEALRFGAGLDFLEWTRSGIDQVAQWTSLGEDASAGVISSFYSIIHASGSLENGVVSAISHAIFQGGVSNSVIAVVAAIVTIASVLFLRFPLRISSLRFYLETLTYPKTTLSRLLFVFRRRRALAIGWAVIYQWAWLGIWALTIVMAPVKYYSYLMYSYILAENPEADPRQALRLSEQMMKGRKWRAFLLDLTFLPWYFLGLLTFGVVTYFYASPYRNLALARLYVHARHQYLEQHNADSVVLTDPYLTAPPTTRRLLVDGLVATDVDDGQYPDEFVPRERDHLRYERDYSLLNIFCLFFSFSLIGWIYESALAVAYVGHFVNRGTLYGPWIPIYGLGAVATLVILKPLRHRPVVTFFAAMGVCGVIEYVSATLIYETTGLTYWSYQGYFFNIQGRVCLEGLLVFGFACTAVIYFLAPVLDTWLNRIPLLIRRWLVGILLVGFLTDFTYCLAYPRTGEGVTVLDGP